ncbi:unnamed protein product [Amoebophrya sp. A25]|nr:unnamed protein product [Amoebophrya sp. A25]|eukprot:GSA25T00003230001.1
MEEFAEEDWMLALLRCELHTLVHAFRKDVNDPERTSFPAIHFGHYYQLYTGKNFGGTLQNFNCKTLEELTRLVPDMCQHTVEMDDFALRREKTALLQDYDLVLPAHDDADMEVCKFIQDTEDARQMRTDRLDAGDENAALTFTYKGANVRGGQVTRTGVAQGGAVGQESFKRPIPNAQQYNDFQAKRSRGGNFQAQNASSGRR